LIFGLALGGFKLSAQDSREAYIRFWVGQWSLDENLGDNADNLSKIIDFLQEARSDSVPRQVEISLCGSASPEGSLKRNQFLATHRRKTLEKYIRKHTDFPDSIVSRCEGAVYDWEQLIRLIEDSDMPHKEEALDVIRNVPELTYNNGVPVEIRKKRLRELQHGRTWKYMYRHFFPRLRHARLVLQIVYPEPETAARDIAVMKIPPVIAMPPLAVAPDAPSALPFPTAAPAKPGRNFIFAVKTNLLYDALTLPNLGVEFRLADRWTISADWMYGWWKNNFSRHYFLRSYGGEVSFRRWFGRRAATEPFTGHHAGVYGQIFTYDFRKGSHGYMGGRPKGDLWDKMSYAVGLEYGYSVPLCRRLNLDMSIGVGYMTGIIHDYTPMDGCKVWQRTRTKHWFGPTKAEISLVWLIGKGGGHD